MRLALFKSRTNVKSNQKLLLYTRLTDENYSFHSLAFLLFDLQSGFLSYLHSKEISFAIHR